jgi:hypothetical protein
VILGVSNVRGSVSKRALPVLLTVFFTKSRFVAQRNSQVIHRFVDNFRAIRSFLVGAYQFRRLKTSQNYRAYEY